MNRVESLGEAGLRLSLRAIKFSSAPGGGENAPLPIVNLIIIATTTTIDEMR